MAQAYYRKFRPQGWDEVVGQEHVIRTLRNAVAQGNIAHAYLFAGPRGTGKTTTARIIAKAVNCLSDDLGARPCNACDHCRDIDQGRFLDLIEIDAASNTSVDDVRDLREKINFMPSQGRSKVYIIDEVHMLSNAAFNALLKTLEEPPKHAIFVLATTEVHKIPATVISRCQRHEFRRIPLNFIQAHLKEIAERENIQVEATAVTAIARQATGSMRDAVSLLDQLASTGSSVTLELTQQVLGTAAGQNVLELVEALLRQDTGQGIRAINRALDGGSDPRQFGRQIVDTLRVILMVKMGNSELVEINQEESQTIKEFSTRFSLPNLLSVIHLFDRAAQYTSIGWQPGLQLELAFSRAAVQGMEEDDTREGAAESRKSTSGKHQPASRASQPPVKNKSTTEPRVSSPQTNKPAAEPFAVNETQGDSRKSMPADNQPTVDPIETDNKNDELAGEQPPSEPDIRMIREQWSQIRASAKEISPETAALLNSTRGMEVTKGRLMLAFSSPMLQSKMENGANRDNARRAIKAVTGLELEVVCRVAGKNQNAVPDGLDIAQDGMVGTALSLGGKIIEES
jgi:DNA polymerase-3 subunit gamma/tau